MGNIDASSPVDAIQNPEAIHDHIAQRKWTSKDSPQSSVWHFSNGLLSVTVKRMSDGMWAREGTGHSERKRRETRSLKFF